MQAILLGILATVAARLGSRAMVAFSKIARAGVLIGIDEALSFTKDSRAAMAAIQVGDHAGAVHAILAEAATHGKSLVLREVNMAIEIVVGEMAAEIEDDLRAAGLAPPPR